MEVYMKFILKKIMTFLFCIGALQSIHPEEILKSKLKIEMQPFAFEMATGMAILVDTEIIYGDPIPLLVKSKSIEKKNATVEKAKWWKDKADVLLPLIFGTIVLATIGKDLMEQGSKMLCNNIYDYCVPAV
jgi:hypothetical protein